jgi:hypothetical protein
LAIARAAVPGRGVQSACYGLRAMNSTLGPACEACRRLPAEIVNGSDNERQPYRLCVACNERLQVRALRPVEWFNLVASHGHQHLLHDDFYDQDGIASQPLRPVPHPGPFAAPSLSEAARDLERMIDFAITRWWIDDDVIQAFMAHDPNAVMTSLARRVEAHRNTWIAARAYEVCARVVGTHAAAWIRSEYGKMPELLANWSEAASAALPVDEAFQFVADMVDRSSDIRTAAAAFAHLRSSRTLDWLETTLPRIDTPMTEGWGRIAALSRFSWDRASKWLTAGRPLSLVALDALVSCAHYDTLLSKRFRPRLTRGAASVQEMAAEIERYMNADRVPRVTRAARFVIGNLPEICGERGA